MKKGLNINSPPWFENLSNPGKEVEARSAKKYGDLFLRGGEYNKAVTMYMQALEINPDFIDATVNLAITFGKMGLNEKAIETLEEALELDPEQPSVICYNLAEIYEKSGKIKEALENYYKAAETARYPMFAYRKIGSLHVGREEYDLAIEAFSLALDNTRTLKNCYIGMLKKAQYAANNVTIVGPAMATPKKPKRKPFAMPSSKKTSPARDIQRTPRNIALPNILLQTSQHMLTISTMP